MKKILLFSCISFFTYSYSQNNLEEEILQEEEPRKVFEELTEEKKEALLGNLYSIYNAKVAAREAKLAQAISVLQANSSSGTSALNFFYDCYEKVKYTDEGKDRSDFLEWKERNNDKYSETEFKTGLQWNMRWLILELRSTGFDKESETSAFKSEVEGFMKNYVSNLKVFKGNYKGVTDGTLRGLVWDLYEIRDNKEFNFPKRITNYGMWYKTHRIKPAIKNQNLADLEMYWNDLWGVPVLQDLKKESKNEGQKHPAFGAPTRRWRPNGGQSILGPSQKPPNSEIKSRYYPLFSV